MKYFILILLIASGFSGCKARQASDTKSVAIKISGESGYDVIFLDKNDIVRRQRCQTASFESCDENHPRNAFMPIAEYRKILAEKLGLKEPYYDVIRKNLLVLEDLARAAYLTGSGKNDLTAWSKSAKEVVKIIANRDEPIAKNIEIIINNITNATEESRPELLENFLRLVTDRLEQFDQYDGGQFAKGQHFIQIIDSLPRTAETIQQVAEQIAGKENDLAAYIQGPLDRQWDVETADKKNRAENAKTPFSCRFECSDQAYYYPGANEIPKERGPRTTYIGGENRTKTYEEFENIGKEYCDGKTPYNFSPAGEVVSFHIYQLSATSCKKYNAKTNEWGDEDKKDFDKTIYQNVVGELLSRRIAQGVKQGIFRPTTSDRCGFDLGSTTQTKIGTYTVPLTERLIKYSTDGGPTTCQPGNKPITMTCQSQVGGTICTSSDNVKSFIVGSRRLAFCENNCTSDFNPTDPSIKYLQAGSYLKESNSWYAAPARYLKVYVEVP